MSSEIDQNIADNSVKMINNDNNNNAFPSKVVDKKSAKKTTQQDNDNEDNNLKRKLQTNKQISEAEETQINENINKRFRPNKNQSNDVDQNHSNVDINSASKGFNKYCVAERENNCDTTENAICGTVETPDMKNGDANNADSTQNDEYLCIATSKDLEVDSANITREADSLSHISSNGLEDFNENLTAEEIQCEQCETSVTDARENIGCEVSSALDRIGSEGLKPNNDVKIDTIHSAQCETAKGTAESQRDSIVVKIEPQENNCNTSIDTTTPAIKIEPPDNYDAQPSCSNNTTNDIKPEIKVEGADAGSTSSTSLRTSCTFGIRCYRLNLLHRNEEAHPGDVDYRRPTFQETPGLPPCPYTHRCYRRNPEHFQQYSHPDRYLPNSPITNQSNNQQNNQPNFRNRDLRFGRINRVRVAMNDSDNDPFSTDGSDDDYDFDHSSTSSCDEDYISDYDGCDKAEE